MKLKGQHLELRAITDDFDCPFCKAKGCCVAVVLKGPRLGEKCVLHPDPGCPDYLKLEPQQFMKAVNHCGCKKLATNVHVAPGWVCCKCRVYNNEARAVCKHCGHEPKPHPYGNGTN